MLCNYVNGLFNFLWSAAGNAHQICFPFGWRIHFVFSAPFGISAPMGYVWTFSVRVHGVTYLLLINLILIFLYFNVVCFSVCHCLGTEWFSTSHLSCCPLPGVVPVFSYVFLHMICSVSCTGGLCHLSCGVNVIVTNFVGEWIMVCWKLILSAWHLIHWRPMFRYSLYMLYFYNLKRQWYVSYILER